MGTHLCKIIKIINGSTIDQQSLHLESGERKMLFVYIAQLPILGNKIPHYHLSPCKRIGPEQS